MINKGQQYVQEGDKDSEEEYEDQVTKLRLKGKKKGKEKGVFTGFQCINEIESSDTKMSLVQAEHGNLKWKFLLDTSSIIQATVMNPDLATNMRPSESPMIMSTNAGQRKLTVDADIEGIGVAKYNPSQIKHILLFTHG